MQELGLEPGADTLARWMAHYIAEHIITAENATEDEKATVEQRCFEIVLKLWQHRSSLPDGRRPFESFEPIFRALDGLDQEKERSFYCLFFYDHLSKLDEESTPVTDDIQEWIDIALGIDRAARVLIDFAFKQAANNAVDEKTSTWLEGITKATIRDESSLVISLLLADKNDQDGDDSERIRQDQEQHLRSKIEKLDAFSDFSNSIRAVLVNELENIDSV